MNEATFVPPPHHAEPGAFGDEDLGRVADNALKVHEALFRFPLVSVNHVAELIEATGNARNRVFQYQDYIGIFPGQ